MSDRKVGRPRSLSPAKITQIKREFKKYINEADVPIIVEFAYMNNIPRTVLYDYAEFSTLKEKCLMKKEAQLEKLCLFGVINATMAVFSLKQIGWQNDHIDVSDSAVLFKHFVNGVLGSQDDD